ncbi:MAG TPA: hypothetical protein VFW40_11290, partial [Capsulimonadaceae bacterium]|nr:hypothetical protein [Capsulimonadaceae bacterium]
MSSETPTPESEYTRKRHHAQAQFDRYACLDDSIANGRLYVFFGGVALAILGGVTHWFSPWWASAFALAFLALVFWQKSVYANRKRYERIT